MILWKWFEWLAICVQFRRLRQKAARRRQYASQRWSVGTRNYKKLPILRKQDSCVFAFCREAKSGEGKKPTSAKKTHESCFRRIGKWEEECGLRFAVEAAGLAAKGWRAA